MLKITVTRRELTLPGFVTQPYVYTLKAGVEDESVEAVISEDEALRTIARYDLTPYDGENEMPAFMEQVWDNVPPTDAETTTA